jgi:DNA-binding CsgD family transcriptional regulator
MAAEYDKLICIVDADPIHVGFFQRIIHSVDSIRLKLFKLEEVACLSDVLPDLVMFNMDCGKQCPQWLLHHLLSRWAGVTVMCYPACRWISPAILQPYGEHVIRLAYAEVIFRFKEYVSGMSDDAPASRRLVSTCPNAGPCEAVLDLSHLSPRELDIFCLLGQGYGTAEMAKLLNRSVKTVECHLYNLRIRLGQGNSAELRHLACGFALSGLCPAFLCHTGHICPYIEKPVGCCPFLNG